jgi:hypothetical protein
MNMPGFTAEASLRSTTSVYRATAGIVSKSGGVQMQIMSWCYVRPGFEGVFLRCCRCSDYGENCFCYNEPLPELFPEGGELP